MPGLADRSRRPKSSPSRVDPEVEALIWQLRREHPRWGARRIGHELSWRQAQAVPGRATVHRGSRPRHQGLGHFTEICGRDNRHAIAARRI
jgi:Homeodomain-like domain